MRTRLGSILLPVAALYIGTAFGQQPDSKPTLSIPPGEYEASAMVGGTSLGRLDINTFHISVVKLNPNTVSFKVPYEVGLLSKIEGECQITLRLEPKSKQYILDFRATATGGGLGTVVAEDKKTGAKTNVELGKAAPQTRLAQGIRLSYGEGMPTGGNPRTVNGYSGSGVIDINGQKVPITALVSQDPKNGESNWRIKIANEPGSSTWVNDTYDFTLRKKTDGK